MRVGLVNVDGTTHKKKWGRNVYPNLALGKLARYHKQRGDRVEWAIPFCHYDIVYMSKVFNFSPDDLTCYDADQVIKGGTGYDINSQLPEEVDRLQPDYSIYPNVDKHTAFGFLTRGCPNRCVWCVVPKKEGRIRPHMDVDEIAIEGRTNLVLMDNNILAAGDYAVEQLEKIIQRGYRIDFNQALDARLVTDDFARLLARCKWIDRRIRFGCDTPGQIQECERAMELLYSHGFAGQFFLYTMLNDNFQECYDRTHYWWERNQQLRKGHTGKLVYPYAQPYRDPVDPSHHPPQWQLDMAGWCNKKQYFELFPFKDFKPRKNFICESYLTQFNNGNQR